MKLFLIYNNINNFTTGQLSQQPQSHPYLTLSSKKIFLLLDSLQALLVTSSGSMAPSEPMQSLEMYWWTNKQAKDSTHIAWFPSFISCSLVNVRAWVHLISFVLASISISTSVSAVWSRSRKRSGDDLERMELNLDLRLGQNGARSRPLSRLAVVFFFSFLFLLLGCGFDNDLIMVGLWVMACGGCGLWAWWWWSGWQRFMGFKIFFFLVVSFIWFWLANGGWPPWLPLAPLWATTTTAKPPSNFRSKHSTTTIGRMNNGAVFHSLVCFYFLFNLWLGSKTFFITVWVWKMRGILVWIQRI